MKLILAGAVLAIALMVVPTAMAQEASVSASPSTIVRPSKTPTATSSAGHELIRDKFAARKETFQQELQQFKDQKKLALIDRIVNKMGNVNKQRTEQMTKALDRMKMVLDTLKTKVGTAKAAGKNTTEAESALLNAQTAITAAETAVASQSAKDYTPTAVTENASLKNIIGAIVSQLESDLQLTHKLVVDAKQALMHAAEVVKHLQLNRTVLSPSPVSSSPSATPIVTP